MSVPAAAGRRMALRTALWGAAVHRRRLEDVVFVAVTGSCGKTTTVSLIGGVLGGRLRGRQSAGNNALRAIAGAVLRTTSADAFSVIEVAAWRPGSVARAARVIRPDVAVVTNIGSDHRTAFRTLDRTAEEKSDLLANVAPGGTAVLNADDPRVIGMASTFRGRTVTYGCAPGAMLRASDVLSAWPERMSFTLCYEGCSLPVRTRLCGRHWVSSALAALGVAVAMGLPLEQAVHALARVDPYPGRMSPLERNGVTFIRDDVKAPLWTVDSALEFLAEANAPRKIAVFGTFSDYPGSSAPKYRAVARRALSLADEVIFVGPHHSHVRKVTAPARGQQYGFRSVEDAAEHLRASLRPADLVLLKGSGSDGLERIVDQGDPGSAPP